MELPPGLDPSRTPLMPNPSGDPPNWIDPPTLAPTIKGVNIAFMIITAIAVAARVYSSSKHGKKFPPDDYFAITGFVTNSGYSGLVMTLEEVSKHVWDVPLSVVLRPNYLQTNFAGVILGIPATFFSKGAIFLMYLRLFGVKTWVRWSCRVGFVVLFLSTWIAIPLQIYYCTPRVGEHWDLVLAAKCDPTRLLGIFQGVFSVSLDIFLLVLPMPVLVKLQMDLKRKIGLMILFSTGLIALVCSVLALYGRSLMYMNKDPTWAAAQSYIVLPAENYAAILVSCAPALVVFWRETLKTSSIFSGIWTQLKTFRGVNSSSSFRAHGSTERFDLQKPDEARVIYKAVTIEQNSRTQSVKPPELEMYRFPRE